MNSPKRVSNIVRKTKSSTHYILEFMKYVRRKNLTCSMARGTAIYLESEFKVSQEAGYKLREYYYTLVEISDLLKTQPSTSTVEDEVKEKFLLALQGSLRTLLGYNDDSWRYRHDWIKNVTGFSMKIPYHLLKKWMK